MSKLVKRKKEPSNTASWDNWCEATSCHCDYLAGLSDIRCKECEQERPETEYVIVDD